MHLHRSWMNSTVCAMGNPTVQTVNICVEMFYTQWVSVALPMGFIWGKFRNKNKHTLLLWNYPNSVWTWKPKTIAHTISIWIFCSEDRERSQSTNQTRDKYSIILHPLAVFALIIIIIYYTIPLIEHWTALTNVFVYRSNQQNWRWIAWFNALRWDVGQSTIWFKTNKQLIL